MNNSLYFLVEGGHALDLARQHINDRMDQFERNEKLVAPLDVERYVVSTLDGKVSGVEFKGDPHPDFKKPDRRGISFPKKRTEWYQKFADNEGHDVCGFELAKKLGIPTTLKYSGNGVSKGWSSISNFFNSGVGFLYLSKDGPFCLYMPDIAAKVSSYEADRYDVCDECKLFKPDFDGARPILKEEWELIVAQHKLDNAKSGETA